MSPPVVAPCPPRPPLLALLVPGLVLALALGSAGWQYGEFLSVHRSLWDNSTHDRNAHYLYGLKLATDVRRGRLLRLLADLESARVWPPLHGVLAGGVLLAGGLDYRLAVLPSLAGWVATAFLAFLLARRALPRGGTTAGLVAALFVLASPAHRAFATDVMLESLGAGLTLLALYAYTVATQSPGESPWPGRCLGLALTALFLHKYNYWLLACLALLAAELLARASVYWRTLRRAASGVDWPRWLRARAWHPLTYLLALLLLAVVAVSARGNHPFTVAGRRVSLYPPFGLLLAAYAVCFVRLVAWWGRAGRGWVATLDVRWRQVICWHVWPVAVWFLLPRHLGCFLWYLSPGNAYPGQKSDLRAGLSDYARWAAQDYHPAAWAAVLAAVLFLVALLSRRRLRPGASAVPCLVLLAAALAVAHPNRKSRNLHSWLAGAWVGAGVGLAALVYGRATSRAPRARPWLGACAVAGLGVALAPGLLAPCSAPEGGPHPARACLLDLTDCYLPAVDSARRAALLAAVPVRPLAEWTLLQRYGAPGRLEPHWDGFGAPGGPNRAGFLRWLHDTPCDTLVFLDRLPGSVWEDVPEVELHAELRDLLLRQSEFRLVREQSFPRHGCRVTVWRRR